MTDDTKRFIQKYDGKLQKVKRNDPQYNEDYQSVLKSRSAPAAPHPVDPAKRSYVFMIELGKWQIMLNGQQQPHHYPNKKQANQALSELLQLQNISHTS